MRSKDFYDDLKIIKKSLKKKLYDFVSISSERHVISLQFYDLIILISPNSNEGKVSQTIHEKVILIEDPDFKTLRAFLKGEDKDGRDFTLHVLSTLSCLKKTKDEKKQKSQFERFPNLIGRLFLKKEFGLKDNPENEFFLFGADESRKRYYNDSFDKVLKVPKKGLLVKINTKSAILYRSLKTNNLVIDIDLSPHIKVKNAKKMKDKTLILKKKDKIFFFEIDDERVSISHPDLLIEVLK